MRLFKTLAKKLFRDIFKNFKQFISIVFIIGISVTLYVGLDANAQSFENRVNNVYQKTNVADEWITISPNFVNEEEMASDLAFIEDLAGVDEGGMVETRFYLPTSLASVSANALVMDHLPKINTPYDIEMVYYTDKDFFFVDKALIERYEEDTNTVFNVGDTLPLNIESSFLKQAINQITSDPESLTIILDSFIDDSSLDETFKTLLKTISSQFSSEIGSIINNIVGVLFSENQIQLNLKVNGIMSHPENIDNGEFSNSNFLISTRLLLGSVVEYIGNKFSSSILISEIESYIETSGNTLINNVLTRVLEYLNEGNNALALDAAIMVVVNTLQNDINDGNNAELEAFISNFYNQIVVKLAPNVDVETFEVDVENHFANKTNNNLLAALKRSSYPSMLQVENDINQAKQLALVFPIIFFVVALLIVLTTISSLILKDRVQIGTFKALGIRKRNIAFYYLAEMNIVSLLGVIIGFIVGPLLLPFIMNIKYNILYSLPQMEYYFPWLTAFIVFIIVAVLVSGLTLILLYSELKEMPTETMRTKAPKIQKFKAHKHIIKNTSFMMAIRNIKVHFAKSLMVVIGVMGCTGLLICGMGIDDTLNYGKNCDLENFYDSDITIGLNGSMDRGLLTEELLRYEEVEKVEEYSVIAGNINATDATITTQIYGVNQNSDFFKFDKDTIDGVWEPSGIALTESVAEDLGVQVGDEVNFDINGTVYTKEVVYIFYAFFVNGAYLYTDTEPELFKTSTNCWVDLKEGVNGNAFKEKVLAENTHVSSCATKEDMRVTIDGYMSSIGMMTNTVKVFAILLAIVVLINLSILNTNERMRELATLKVLGFSRTKIVMSLTIEMLILTIVGGLLGLAVGLPLEYLVLSVNETPLVSWLYLVYPETYVISFFLSVLTALVVNLFMYFKVDKISMSESLKSVDE